MPEGPKSAVF